MSELPAVAMLQAYARDTLSAERFVHVQGVVHCAERLAVQLGADVRKAVSAAWLHDIAKEYAPDDLLKLAEHFGIIFTEVEIRTPALWHAPIGARIARRQFEIMDLDVLAAIRFHTTGRAGMSSLEQIIFLADIIEPTRTFDGVEQLRELSHLDFDGALLAAFDNVIRFVVERKGLLHPDTVAARNDILFATG